MAGRFNGIELKYTPPEGQLPDGIIRDASSVREIEITGLNPGTGYTVYISSYVENSETGELVHSELLVLSITTGKLIICV